MPLKMTALWLDANFETLRPLYYRGTHRLKGDFCRCFHEGSLPTVQVALLLLLFIYSMLHYIL